MAKHEMAKHIANTKNWPKDRDVLFNSSRKSYLKGKKKEGCIFCQAAEARPGFKNLLLYKDQFSMVILNKYPYHTGHVMVLPIRHIAHLEALEEQEFLHMQLVLRTTNKVLKEVYGAAGMNLGLNLGRVAGAGIPDHLHWHIIPRWPGDCNFFPELAKTRILPETLKESFQRIQKPLQTALGEIYG